jgi:peroxiredoxin
MTTTFATRSELARDAALARVARPDFMSAALAALADLDGDFTGEEIRIWLTQRGIVPHHSNAWGALIRAAVVRHLIEETGEWRKMRAVSSHARRTPVYRRAA